MSTARKSKTDGYHTMTVSLSRNCISKAGIYHFTASSITSNHSRVTETFLNIMLIDCTERCIFKRSETYDRKSFLY